MPETISQPEGKKYDTGKLRYDLLPVIPLRLVTRIFTFGAAKYADRNWEKGIQWSRVYAAAQRHLQAFWGGQSKDPESRLPHLAHAIVNLLFLLEYSRTHKELDDRPCR